MAQNSSSHAEDTHLVVVPDDSPPVVGDSAALARLRREKGVQVLIFNRLPGSEDDLVSMVAGAHTVFVTRSSSRFNHAVLERSPSVKHIAVWGPATDHISLDSARRLGIAVTNTPDAATAAVAEHALALAFALAKKIPELDLRVRENEWPRGMLTQLEGRTMGIVGTGAVGSHMSRISAGVGMETLGYSVTGESHRHEGKWSEITGFEDLLRRSDVVSLHARLSAQTSRMFGREQFALMKPTAFIVNTARGGLIDEMALAEALRNETIAGAALDVFNREPLPDDSPLRFLPNVILSPHSAASTAESLNKGLNMAVDNIVGFLKGRAGNRIV